VFSTDASQAASWSYFSVHDIPHFYELQYFSFEVHIDLQCACLSSVCMGAVCLIAAACMSAQGQPEGGYICGLAGGYIQFVD